jgi:hypothetical protein
MSATLTPDQVIALKSQLQNTIINNAMLLGFEEKEVSPKVLSEPNLFALYQDIFERLFYYSNLKSLVLLVDNSPQNLRTIKKQTLESYKTMYSVLLLKYKEQIYNLFAKTHINETWLQQLSTVIDQAAQQQKLSELNLQFQVYAALIAELKDMLEIMGHEFKFLQTMRSLEELKQVFESVIEDFKRNMMSKYSSVLGIKNVSNLLSAIQPQKYYDRLVKQQARDLADELQELSRTPGGGKKFVPPQDTEQRDKQREEIRNQVKKDQQQEIKAAQEEAERVRREKEAQTKRAEEEQARMKQKHAEAERKMKEEFARQQEELLRKQREQRQSESEVKSSEFTFKPTEGCRTIAELASKEICRDELGQQVKSFGMDNLANKLKDRSNKCLQVNNVFRLLTDFESYNSTKSFNDKHKKQRKTLALAIHPDKNFGKDYQKNLQELFTVLELPRDEDEYSGLIRGQCK